MNSYAEIMENLYDGFWRQLHPSYSLKLICEEGVSEATKARVRQLFVEDPIRLRDEYGAQKRITEGVVEVVLQTEIPLASPRSIQTALRSIYF